MTVQIDLDKQGDIVDLLRLCMHSDHTLHFIKKIRYMACDEFMNFA